LACELVSILPDIKPTLQRAGAAAKIGFLLMVEKAKYCSKIRLIIRETNPYEIF